MNRSQFIEAIGNAAAAVMVESGLLASITVAQALLESWNSKEGRPSTLAAESFNLFGIKGTGTAGSKKYRTREVINGKSQYVMADFRVYRSWEESIADRTKLLLNARRGDGEYRYRHIAGVTDPDLAARLIYKAGYATDAPREVDGDPDYAEKLVAVIRSNDLTRFDKLAEQLARGSKECSFPAARAFVMAEGISDGSRPKDPVTREEVWEMMRRLVAEGGKA